MILAIKSQNFILICFFLIDMKHLGQSDCFISKIRNPSDDKKQNYSKVIH